MAELSRNGAPRYIIEAIAPKQRSKETGLSYRITDTHTDSRIATCYLGENASLIVRALNASVSETATRDAQDAARYRGLRRFEVSKQNAAYGEASTDEAAFDSETDLLLSSEELQQKAIMLAKERARG